MVYRCTYKESENSIFNNKNDKRVIKYLSEKIFNKAKNEITLDSKYGELDTDNTYILSINILSDKRYKKLLEKEELLDKILNKVKELNENTTVS